MNFKRFLSFFAVVSIACLLVACAEDEEDQSNESSDTDEAAELEGSVVIDGSGTVFPLMSRIAEEYMVNEQQGVSVEVGRSGTSAGFEKFLIEDGSDFNDASREIKDEEVDTADELGIDVKEFKVALDGLTFVIHPDNDWATELTEEQVISIFSDPSITHWSDLDPSFPDEAIQPYGPNENHGTYEFFWENILDKEDLVDHVNLQQEYSTLVSLIADDPNGIAFFGFGYYVNNTDQLKAVAIDFGEGGVEPSLDTIAEDGPYAPFTRPVFTYLNVNAAKEKPEVIDFALYLVQNMNTFAGETGFAPLPFSEVEEYEQFLKDLQ